MQFIVALFTLPSKLHIWNVVLPCHTRAYKLLYSGYPCMYIIPCHNSKQSIATYLCTYACFFSYQPSKYSHISLVSTYLVTPASKVSKDIASFIPCHLVKYRYTSKVCTNIPTYLVPPTSKVQQQLVKYHYTSKVCTYKHTDLPCPTSKQSITKYLRISHITTHLKYVKNCAYIPTYLVTLASKVSKDIASYIIPCHAASKVSLPYKVYIKYIGTEQYLVTPANKVSQSI